MINGLEGIPGSGKSYEAVVHHALHYVKAGRKIITNLPLNLDAFAAINPAYLDLIEVRTKPVSPLGTWDADRTPAFEIGEVPVDPLENEPYTPDRPRVRMAAKGKLFGDVWDFYSDWKGPNGEGPVFIVDECHVGMPKIGTSAALIEWYKLHRHFNCDVLLITQNFRDVCPEIAHLVAMLVKVRKADILGKKDCYIRKVHGGYRGAVISTEERPYQKQFFTLYKSHTQGNSVSEASAVDVTPINIKWRRMTWALFAVGAIITAWPYVMKWVNKSSTKPEAMAMTMAPSRPASAPHAPVKVEPEKAAKPVDPTEPYSLKEFHLTGRASMGDKIIYMFSVSQNGLTVSNVSHIDLERSGYTFQALTDCAGLIRFKETIYPVTCDVAQVAMGAGMPQTNAQTATAAPFDLPPSPSVTNPASVATGRLDSGPGPDAVRDGEILASMNRSKRTPL